MGQQQLLIILLSMLVIAVAIAVGISLFGSNATMANRDAIINDMSLIASEAAAYRARPSSLGGGNGSFVGYKINAALSPTANASYALGITPDAITVTATSEIDPANTVKAVVDTEGKLADWAYSGGFQ